MFFSFFIVFNLLFIMGKDIGWIYKHGQSQISNSSFKSPDCSYLASQTSSSIELTTIYVPYVRDKKQNNSVLGSKNSIQNDLSITNNDNIQSCETEGKQNCSIPTTSTPNHRAQRISNTSASMLNLHKTAILPPVGK